MTTNTIDNGVNVQALLEAREALTQAPEAAKFTWRAHCKWINGTHSRSNVQGFYGLGQEQSHKTALTHNLSQRCRYTRVELNAPSFIPIISLQ